MGTTPRRRAAPLSPEQRRAALVAATLPLVREHGLGVTTRQIAEAAGVAEGTLFRVFPDKTALLCAVVEEALHPRPTVHALWRVPGTLPLRERLYRAVDILTERMRANGELLAALRAAGPVQDTSDTTEGARHVAGRAHGPPELFRRRMRSIIDAVAVVAEPDRGRLTCDPRTLARLLVTFTMMSTRGCESPENQPTGHALVDLLLDGALAPIPASENRPEPGRLSR